MSAISFPILRWVPPDRQCGDEVQPGWLLFLRPFPTAEAAREVAVEEGGNVWPSGPVHDPERCWAVVVRAVGLPGDTLADLRDSIRRAVTYRRVRRNEPIDLDGNVLPVRQGTLFE